MIKKLKTITSIVYYPYFNQSLEKFLLDNVQEDTMILYLWQNEHAFLYGRDYRLDGGLSAFEEADEYPVRRLSQDQPYHQNTRELNFAFLYKEETMKMTLSEEGIPDQEGLLMPILRTALTLSGADLGQLDQDLARFGRKLIETTSYSMAGRECFHGRICLGYCPEIEIEDLRRRLFAAFEEHFHLSPEPLTGDGLDESILNTYIKFFAGQSWLEQGDF